MRARNTTIASEPLPDAVERLIQEFDGDIVTVGSITLLASLIAENLADELRLLLLPAIAGGGGSIFTGNNGLLGAAHQVNFELINNQPMETSAVILTYPRASV